MTLAVWPDARILGFTGTVSLFCLRTASFLFGDVQMAMAKKKTPAAAPDPAKMEREYRSSTVETAIAKIAEAYELGKKSRARHGTRLHGRRDKPVPRFAARRGLRRSTVDSARLFARVFTLQDLKAIYRSCREHEFPLGITLVYRTTAIEKRTERMKLLNRAIRERWTQKRLGIEVRRLSGSKPFEGRPQKLPKTSAEAKMEIISRLKPILNWLKVMNSSEKRQLVHELRPELDKAVKALRVLVEAVS